MYRKIDKTFSHNYNYYFFFFHSIVDNKIIKKALVEIQNNINSLSDSRNATNENNGKVLNLFQLNLKLCFKYIVKILG